jgi:hypothetical protein
VGMRKSGERRKQDPHVGIFWFVGGAQECIHYCAGHRRVIHGRKQTCIKH